MAYAFSRKRFISFSSSPLLHFVLFNIRREYAVSRLYTRNARFKFAMFGQSMIVVFFLKHFQSCYKSVIRELRKQTKAVVVHVRYKSLNISLPFSTRQKRDMTKFCGLMLYKVVLTLRLWIKPWAGLFESSLTLTQG